ncbi:MAG: RluA family pseudouridine synthase [Spirochaetaceae bacterium]|nr:RluA family pseudouridine synthase [Spirochaetaceae bacterium]
MSSSKGLSSFIKIGTAGADDNNKRIDRIIRTIIPSLSLGSIYKEIRQGRIRINGKKTDSGNRINTGDSIDIHKSLAEIVKKDIETIISKKENLKNNSGFEKLEIDILFENSLFIVINKPSGILTHTGAKTSKNSPTLDDAIKKLLIKKSQQSLAFSPAPLHRLDKETSGVLFFSKSIEGARIYTSFLRGKMFIKKYIALLDGHLSKSCTWKDFLSREDKENRNLSSRFGEQNSAKKEAVTHIKPLLYSSGHTLALVEIETGRYRQIRKQCSMHGFPLSGDTYAIGGKHSVGGKSSVGNKSPTNDRYCAGSVAKKYAPLQVKKGEQNIPFGSTKQSFFLHCWKIELKNKKDVENMEKLGFASITAPLPKLFMEKIVALFGEDKILNILPQTTQTP